MWLAAFRNSSFSPFSRFPKRWNRQTALNNQPSGSLLLIGFVRVERDVVVRAVAQVIDIALLRKLRLDCGRSIVDQIKYGLCVFHLYHLLSLRVSSQLRSTFPSRTDGVSSCPFRR